MYVHVPIYPHACPFILSMLTALRALIESQIENEFEQTFARLSLIDLGVYSITLKVRQFGFYGMLPIYNMPIIADP